MDKFHIAAWEQRRPIVDQIKDDRLIEFGRRLIYLERPNLLDGEQGIEVKTWMASRIHADDDAPWMTIPKALAEADELMETTDETGCALLVEVKQFLTELATKHS